MRRAPGWTVLGLLLLLTASAPARALTLAPGQALEIDFSFAAPPVFTVSPSVTLPPDVLTFRIVLGPATTGASGLDVELFDGATSLGSVSSGLATLIFGFADPASNWPIGLNRTDASLASVVDGTIQGRLRLVPTFGAGGGALEITLAEILTGATDAFGGLLVASPSPLASAPRVLPEPAAALLLLLAALPVGRRPRAARPAPRAARPAPR
jgi:hypothetical protein